MTSMLYYCTMTCGITNFHYHIWSCMLPPGLWSSATGRIRTPAPSSVFFLPQKPFMPLGTLRHQLIFPSGALPEPTTHLPLLHSNLSEKEHTRVAGMIAAAW